MDSPEFLDLSRVYVRFSWWDIGGIGVLLEQSTCGGLMKFLD